MSVARKTKWTIGVALILALCAGGACYAVHNLTGARVARFASNHLGRTLSIDGPLKIDFGHGAATVHAEQVRLANVDGAKVVDMAKIGSIDFAIKLWPLLRGHRDIPYLRVSDAEVYLEKQDDTHANWDFPALSTANVAKQAVTVSDRSDVPVIGQIEVENSTLVYHDVPKDLSLSAKVNTAQGEGKQSFTLDGTGVLSGKDFAVKAAGGSLEMLRDTDKDFPLNLDITFGKTHVVLDGTFRDPVRLKGLKANLQAEGPNLADVFYITHIPLPPSPPYKIAGTLEKDKNVWSFHDFSGHIGGSDVAGTIIHEIRSPRALTKGNIRSEHMDVADMGGFIGLAPKRAELAAASSQQKTLAQKEAESPYLLPDTPLDVKRLRASDLDITFDAGQLQAPGWPLSDMHARFVIDDGVVRVDPLRFGVADGSINGFVSVDGSKDVPSAEASLDLHALSLKRFFKDPKFADFAKGHFGGGIRLSGSGASLADILGDSGGRVVVLISGGSLSLLMVNEMDLDVARTLPTLLFGKNGRTEIRCGIGDFAVTHGRLNSQTFVLDTTASNVQGNAAIDLKTEDMDVAIDAHPKDPSLLALQSRILVTGSLKHPSIAIDPLQTGLRAAAAAALGVLAPPAALLPFIETGLGKDSDCAGLMTATAEPAAGDEHAGR